MKLKGKVGLITGGAIGIGRGICRAFVEEGASVIVNYNQSKKEAEKLIKEFGDKCIAIRADVSKKEEVDEMVKEAVSSFGKINILVNNAGISEYCSFLKLEEEIWDRTIDINLKGIFLCSKAVVKDMIEKKTRGKIINISSVCGLLAQKGLVHYSASKSGINSMTKTMCLELGPYGINVNCIAAGNIEIDRTKDELNDPSSKKRWENIIPVGRWGQPEDIGKIAVFLASNDSDFICGETIYADGGQTIKLTMPESFNYCD